MDLAPAIAALTQATQSLALTANQLMQFAQGLATLPPTGRSGALGGVGEAGPGFPALAQINSWEDDPFSEATPTTNPSNASPISVGVPLNSNPKLQTAIVEARPAPVPYQPGTANFRYWATAEVVTRGINFWGPLLPSGTTWSTSNPMQVTLVAGETLNANYSRGAGLRFYHKVIRNLDIFSCESPDVACHELGHAILDALRPQLFNVASTEAGAFHESFGDMSAILSALQLPSLRSKVIAETQGRLNVNSRLSRLAEQLGWGIRQLSPTAVDRDCLRNAANRFVYERPDLLPPSAPANLLSSEIHSFSRVFTGAFLDALAQMFAIAGIPNEANLLAVTRDMGHLLVDGILAAPITPAYFSQVAAAIVQADQARNGGRYRSALTGAFVQHGILSVSAVAALANAPVPRPVSLQPAATPQLAAVAAFEATTGSPIIYAYDGATVDGGYRLGYGETPELSLRTTSLDHAMTFAVHVPDEQRRFEVTSASASVGAWQPEEVMTPENDSRHFVEDLLQQRRINLGAAKGLLSELSQEDPTKSTHVLVSDGGGQMVLKRSHFDCGWCHAHNNRSP